MSRVNKNVIKNFKQILNDLKIEYEKIYLFGSRARGSFDVDSDWDFFIILTCKIDSDTKRDLRSMIRMKFHDYYPDDAVDIIMYDSESFSNDKLILNTISNEVYTEGIAL